MNPSNKLCFSEQFSHSWVTGKYISLGSYSIGDVVDTTPATSSTGWNCQSFSVKSGDTVYIHLNGGQDCRAYAILDVNKRLLEVASASDTAVTLDITLTIANDGYVVLNNYYTIQRSPVVTHKGVREPSRIYLNGYAKRVHIGSDKVWIHKDESVFIGANQEMTWSAVGAGYIDLNKTIGTVISFTPQTSATQQYSIISVKKGDVFLLTCAGGTYGKPWGLLDDSRKLLLYCTTAGVTNSPLTASADGFLVVNNIADTQPSPICKRVNPHKYDTVKIGNQVWMATNLDENLGLLQSNQWYYNNDKTTYGKEGKLYTCTNLSTNLASILPTGWRLPTKSDFDNLATTCGGESVAGQVLKSDSWDGTDAENFGAVVGGCWNPNASMFTRLDSSGHRVCYMWSATTGETSDKRWRICFLESINSVATLDILSGYGLSVRLVKDAVSLTSVATPTSASSDDESDTTEETE